MKTFTTVVLTFILASCATNDWVATEVIDNDNRPVPSTNPGNDPDTPTTSDQQESPSEPDVSSQPNDSSELDDVCGDGLCGVGETGESCPGDCHVEEVCGYDTGIRVLIVLDRSGSMAPGWSPHPTIDDASVLTEDKWAQARVAVQEFMRSPAAEHIEFGLAVFPTDDECGISGQIIYPASEASADNVDNFFGTYGPSGLTPLWSTLDHVLSNTSGAGLDDRDGYYNYILLVSDGKDTCYDRREECNWFGFDCEMQSYPIDPQRLVEVTSRLRDEAAIRTFVIGFGSLVDEAELDAIAASGGTELNSWLPVTNVEELTTAFQTILDELLECHPI